MQFRSSPPREARVLLPSSLKDDTAKINDRNKHKVTGQMNHQTADPKANASVFLFFPNAHFLKTILANRTNDSSRTPKENNKPVRKWHIWFCPTHKPTLRKTKRAIFNTATNV